MENIKDSISEEIKQARQLFAEELILEAEGNGYKKLSLEESALLKKKYLKNSKTDNAIEINLSSGNTAYIPLSNIVAFLSKVNLIDCTNGETLVSRIIIFANPNFNFDLLIERGSANDEPPILSFPAEYFSTNEHSKLLPTEQKSLKKQPGFSVYENTFKNAPGFDE